MTIAGVNVLGPAGAVAWSDSQVFVADEPADHVCKLAINPVAGLVGTGCGSLALLLDAAAAVLSAACMEVVVERLPGVLRGARADASSPAARALYDHAAFCIVGRSARFGRVVAYVFRSQNDFAAALASAWCSPTGTIAASAVSDVDSAVATAHMQLTALRRALPRAGGGSLIVAEIADDRITTSRFSFGSDAPARHREEAQS